MKKVFQEVFEGLGELALRIIAKAVIDVTSKELEFMIVKRFQSSNKKMGFIYLKENRSPK